MFGGTTAELAAPGKGNGTSYDENTKQIMAGLIPRPIFFTRRCAIRPSLGRIVSIGYAVLIALGYDTSSVALP
jgi:hypothetical protein